MHSTVPPLGPYDEMRAAFRWHLPARLNIATVCADRHPPDALALIEDGGREVTFRTLRSCSARLANGLAGLGIAAGDRVGIVLPQRLETALVHLAVARLGAVSLPLSGLFGPDALRYRLGDAAARAVVTDSAGLDKVADVAGELGCVVIVADEGPARPHVGLWDVVAAAAELGEPAATGPDTPALLIYTSGTTGAPKGALHGHRVLLGHLPGFELAYDGCPRAGDRVWTPADWAWIGGLLDAAMPAWYHGLPVIATARSGAFDPDWAIAVMARHRVTCAFLPPTALKLLRRTELDASNLALRAVLTGGEPLGAALLAWGRERLGASINEIYGQTEANLVVGNCAAAWEVRPGAMGRPLPGHDVAVLGPDHQPLGPGEIGEVAVRLPDPVAFLGYWKRPDATAEKTRGGWLHTGDLASADADGYLHFAARADDLINSAGYRIGPAEVEEC
jgi:acetyl-CoA synthetase